MDFETFERRFLHICEEHKEQDRALAFAFILYGTDQPHIFKILDDGRYWEALHAKSGKQLTIFTIKQRDSHVSSVSSSEKKFSSLIWNFTAITAMTPVNYKGNPLVGYDSLLRQYFGKDILITYPAILLFQVEEGKIIDSLIVKLKEVKVEDGYNEIKKYINSAVSALEKIEKPYSRNSKEIFDLIELDIKSISAGENIIRVAKGAKDIVGFVKLLKSFLG